MISVMKSGGAGCHLSFPPCKHFNGVCALLHHQHSSAPTTLCAKLKLTTLGNALFSPHCSTGQCFILDTECLRSTIQSLQVLQCVMSCSSAPCLKCFGRSQHWTAQLQPRVKSTKVMMLLCVLASTEALFIPL